MLSTTSGIRYFHHHTRRFLTRRCNIVRNTITIDGHPHVSVIPPQALIQRRFITTTGSCIPFHVRCWDRHYRLLHTSSINKCSNKIQLNQQPSVDEKQQLQRLQPMSYYERTVTFSNSIYKLYQDYLLYQNITSAYQTATTSRSNHHAWAQRYRTLREMSHRFQFHADHNLEKNHYRPNTVIESTVALIVQQQQQHNTYQYVPNLVIPYRAQEQQYQFMNAMGKVTPTVLFCMIPIIGYVPMLLAILLPRQLLCYHFYNHYEILYYNDLQYQQRQQYFGLDDTTGSRTTNTIETYIRRIVEKQQQRQHQPSELSLSSSTSFSNTTSTDDIISIYRDCASMVNDAPPNKGDGSAKTKPIAQMYNILQLHTYPRDVLIRLALVTGMYSSTITNQTLQYYIIVYGTPTFVLRYYLHALAKRILRNDQLLICEEYLATTSSSPLKMTSSFVQTNMTDIELSNACLLRGIPTTIVPTSTPHPTSSWSGPQSLLEHINIVASLLHITHEPKLQPSSTSNVPDKDIKVPIPLAATTLTDQDMEQIGLFMLHVPLIRRILQNNK